MRVIIFILVTVLIAIGCGKNSSEKKQKEVTQQINDYLTVIMKVKVLEDDIFEIYYAENLENTYLPKERVQTSINGNNEFQEITFRFPRRVYPLKLRFDLGLKKNVTDIEIAEIELSTGKKYIKFSTEEIVKRFRFNQYIFYNPGTNSFKRKIVDDIYDPLMLSGDLSKEITHIFSE